MFLTLEVLLKVKKYRKDVNILFQTLYIKTKFPFF